MTGLPFTDQTVSPAVRAPVLKISQASEPAGGLGGLAGAAADLLGGRSGPDPWQSYLVNMRMTLALGQVGHVSLHLLEGEEAPQVSLGDKLEFSLGFDDEGDAPIFTGSVSALQSTVAGYRRVTLTSPLLTLAQQRLNSSFEEQTSGDIIQSLLGETDVEPGNIDSGELYPFYVVSDTRSLLEHINRLAYRQNWICYGGPDGRLNAHEVASGEPARSFAYGADIIGLKHSTRESAVAGVKVIGAGAASGSGAQAWSWLTKTPGVTGSSGSPDRVVPARALRSNDAAQHYATALQSRDARKTKQLQLLTAAAPEVLPGLAFSVEEAPDGDANGTYVAERVVLSFDMERGFLSRIDGFSQDAGGGAAGLLGGLL